MNLVIIDYGSGNLRSVENAFKISINNNNLNFKVYVSNNLKLIKDEGTNIYDLFKYKNVIITSSSVKKIQNRLLDEKN